MEAKKYKIRSFEDLCNLVNNDNVEMLSIDLCNWLRGYNHTLSIAKDKNPEMFENKTNWEAFQGGFIWIDDGKNDLLDIVLETIKKRKS